MKPASKNRVFIVGSPRSGTTLLQSLLGCSPQIATFRESHLYSNVFSARHTWLVLKASPVREALRFFSENGLDPTGMPPPPKPFDCFRKRLTSRYLLSVLDCASELKGKPSWLEKTPRHLRFTDLIEAGSDDPVKFIHLIRDGVAVAASMAQASKLWKATYSPTEAVLRWQDDLRMTRELSKKPNHHVVVYEQLIASPESVLLSLSKRIGICLDVSDLENRKSVLESVIHPRESWKTDTMGLDIGALRRTSAHLPVEQISKLDSLIDRTDYQYLSLTSYV